MSQLFHSSWLSVIGIDWKRYWRIRKRSVRMFTTCLECIRIDRAYSAFEALNEMVPKIPGTCAAAKAVLRDVSGVRCLVRHRLLRIERCARCAASLFLFCWDSPNVAFVLKVSSVTIFFRQDFTLSDSTTLSCCAPFCRGLPTQLGSFIDLARFQLPLLHHVLLRSKMCFLEKCRTFF